MSWDAIAAIGQAVSALALVIVIVQFRHARSEVRRSISQTRAEGARELMMVGANSPDLCNLLTKLPTTAATQSAGTDGGEMVATAGLTVPEAYRVSFFQMAWWQYRAQVIQYIDDLSEGERFGFDNSVRQSYDGSRIASALWYANQKATLNPDAVRYVDDLLAQPG